MRTASETSVDNHFTRQYIPEDNSEHRASAAYVFMETTSSKKKRSPTTRHGGAWW
jgi:hypothetical protein